MVGTAQALLQAAVQFGSGLLYLWVARVVLNRRFAGDAKRANGLFALWWVGLGATFIVASAYGAIPRLLGFRDIALATTLLNALLILLVVAVWALVSYLAYLYSGKAPPFAPITAFYIALGVGLLYAVAWLNPSGFDGDGRVVFERQQLAGAPGMALGLLFSLPVVIAALAYGSLFFRVRDVAARYRIGLVAGAFLVQFGWSAVSSALQLSRRYPNSLTLALVSNGLGVAAALAILLAFRPPRLVRDRLDAWATRG